MKRVLNVLLVLISLLLCACEKDIFFSNGPTTQTVRTIHGKFRFIELHDNVDVNLVHSDGTSPDSATVVKIVTGENLTPAITTVIHGDTLVIRNENVLNWLRPYDYPLEVTVYYDTLYKIVFNSNGNLKSDTLRGYDKPMTDTINRYLSHLYLRVEGGSGDIKLLTCCDRLHTNYEFGTSAVTVAGNAAIAYTTTSYNSHGLFDASRLETNIHYVYASGTNITKTKAFHEVQIENHNNGVNYYVEYTGKKTVYQYDSLSHTSVPTLIDITCPEVLSYNNTAYNTLEYHNEVSQFQKITELE